MGVVVKIDLKKELKNLYKPSAKKITLKEDASIPDFTVMPMENLWWISGGTAFEKAKSDDWRWIVMVAQPEFINEEHLAEAKRKLRQKAGSPPAAGVRLRSYSEGLSAQVMHIGPYSSIGDSAKRIEEYAGENGYKLRSRHHEIYMSDPRRVAPDKLKTIVRHPLK